MLYPMRYFLITDQGHRFDESFRQLLIHHGIAQRSRPDAMQGCRQRVAEASVIRPEDDEPVRQSKRAIYRACDMAGINIAGMRNNATQCPVRLGGFRQSRIDRLF